MDNLASKTPGSETETEQLHLELDLYKNKFKQAEFAYQQLLYNFKQLQRDKFGRKSERCVDPNLPKQGDLFAEFFTDEEMPKKFSQRFGVDISRSNLARWFVGTAQALQPLINLMKDEIIDYDVASCDATSIQVLGEPGRAATNKSYLYCMRGGPPDKEAIFYDYNPTTHKPFLVSWFAGFKGYIHVDAQNIFDELGKQEGVILVYCNAHSRRKFEAITKSAKADGLAKVVMRFYRKLYK